MAGQPAAILRPVLQVLVRGQPERPGLHGVVQDLFHLVQLGVGHGGSFPGRYHAQYVATQGREWHQRSDVYAQTLFVQAVHVFRESLPVPSHPQPHGFQRYRFDAVHHAHIEVPIFRSGGSEAKSALTNGEGGYPEPSGQGCVGVPIELRIVVGVEVYGPRRHDTAAGVQLPGASGVDASRDHGHPPVLDPNISAEAGKSCAIDHGSATNHQIKFWHTVTSNGDNCLFQKAQATTWQYSYL